MKVTVTMLPCPFCGGEATLTKAYYDHCGELRYEEIPVWNRKHASAVYVPHCMSCDCVMDAGWDKEEIAIERWNHRHDLPQP